MHKHCYYCGRSPALKPVEISPTFTAGGLVKVPHSDAMCDRCHGIMFGDIQRVWYHNVDENRHVALYLRGIHQLWSGDTLINPALLPPQEHTQISAAGKVGKLSTYHALTHVPKRLEVRDWLINPPEPPFTIAIAESGQKHILFLAQEGYSRDIFPVQFEMDSLQIERHRLINLLTDYESLLCLGFSKTEIDSGEYRPDRIMANFDLWQQHDKLIAPLRAGAKASRLLQLISFVGQRPEFTELKKTKEAPPKDTDFKKQEARIDAQLTLF